MSEGGERIESLFAEAVKLVDPREQAAFLDRSCIDEPELRRNVESLLEAADQAGDFLEPPFSAPPPSVADRRPSTPPTARGVPEIPGFTIVRKLGEGGLGVVFEAQDDKLQRRVALKVLHQGTGEERRRRILNEARRAAALQDPAVVTIHAVLDEGQVPAIVMEYIEGRPLDRATHSMGSREKARLFQELCRVLAVAHEQQIIHRDIKPQNVLVTPDRQIKILDFGLAVSPGESDSESTNFEGSPFYASPEQATNRPLTSASDMFSLGSTMFKVLVGNEPFTGKSVQEILEEICLSDPPFPRDLAVGIPVDLQSICLACLTRDPDKRPTAREVAADLGRHLAGESIRLRPALYGDLLRQRISEISRDLENWEHQGMISSEEHDRLQAVNRRILTDEDHWIIDARRLTVRQTVLYTSTWVVVVASALLVWLLRDSLSPTMRWLAPVSASACLIGVGLVAEWRRERLAAASFLACAVLSLVPAALSCMDALNLWAVAPDDVVQLFGDIFTNQQVCVAVWTGLGFSLLALARLKLTGFAWTTACLTVASYLGILLLLNWLDQDPEIAALWALPLVAMEGAALGLERMRRVRWAFPFHLAALVFLVLCLDIIAVKAPTLEWLGLSSETSPLLNENRLVSYSLALNGVFFLILMLLTERSFSLDLRRISRILEILALLHILSPLYMNALFQEDDALRNLDVALYLISVAILLFLGPWRSRWRLLVGALGGLAFGCHLLIYLEIVRKEPFVIFLGITGLVVAIGTFIHLLNTTRNKR
jgi:serine/threonine protein kinase